jgi:hypothetical protein
LIRARGSDRHRRDYARYWSWSEGRLYRAYQDGVLITRDGWQCRVSSRTPERTARNWLIQANSAGIFRLAGLMAQKIGIKIVALVHDALLIEAPAGRIDDDVVRATECLMRASRVFLHGLELRVDVKVYRDGERFTDPRGAKVWTYVEQTLHELDQQEGRA